MSIVSFPLSNGGETLVDQADVMLLAGRTWARVKCGQRFYACAYNSNGSPKRLYMHRFLLGVHGSKRPPVDHIDGNSLNNSRTNLRLATFSLNSYNRSTKSRFRGVFRQDGSFIAKIGRHYAGAFPTETAAALAVDKLAVGLYGEAAILNFPKDIGCAHLNRRFLEVM